MFKQIQRFEWRKCSLGKTPLQRQFKLEQPQVQNPSFSSFFVGTAIQLVILPPHIPWIGQGGGILLLHYSVICVEAFLIFTRWLENFFCENLVKKMVIILSTIFFATRIGQPKTSPTLGNLRRSLVRKIAQHGCWKITTYISWQSWDCSVNFKVVLPKLQLTFELFFNFHVQ